MANDVVQRKQSMAAFLSEEAVQKQVFQVVGKKDAQSFISSVVSAVQTNPALAECTNASVLSAALVGQSLKLPHSPQLAYYYFVPFDNKKKDANGKEYKVKEAAFMISYRGLMQLALRSGMYKKIHVTSIKEGELKSYDPIEDVFTFEPVTDINKRLELKPIGYYAYFILNNGSRKDLYWTKEKMEAHAKKYSASYRSTNKWVHDNSLWNTSFDDMAYKTLIKQLLSKWGVMSVEMQMAYKSDMAVLDENFEPNYVDNVPDEPMPAKDVLAEDKVIEGEAHEITEDVANEQTE